MGVATGEPLGVAGLEVAGHRSGHRPLAFDVAEEVEVGDGDEQVRASVVMRGDHAPGLEFELGDANAVFDEEDFFGAAVEDVEAAVFVGVGGVPVRWGLAQLFVLQDFDGHIAEGLSGEIAGEVGVAAGEESGLAVLQLDGDGIFALDGVDDFRVSERDVDVVVAMAVHKSFGTRGDVDVEDADLIVGEGEVVVGLGGDFDFRGGLRGEEGG